MNGFIACFRHGGDDAVSVCEFCYEAQNDDGEYDSEQEDEQNTE